MTTLPFTNFTKGEISPELQARLDTSQYAAGARKVRNFIIQRYGGLSFRPGFRLVGEVDDVTKNIRYIPFQFNLEQAYIMAVEDQKMRLLAKGGFIAEENIKITDISKDVNARVTAALHMYTVGERIFLSGIVGMAELNGRSATVVSVIDANNFTININTTGYATFVSSDGAVRTAPPPAPPANPAPPPAPPPEPPAATTTESGGSGSGVGSSNYGENVYDYPQFRSDQYVNEV